MFDISVPKFSKAVQDEKFAELFKLKKIPEKTKEELARYQKVREELILNNIGLSILIAKRYCEKFHMQDSFDDITSECIYALEVAIDTFDDEKGSHFSSFFCKSADHHLTKLYHKSKIDALTAFDIEPTEYRHAKNGDEMVKNFDLDWLPDHAEDIPETFAQKDLIEKLLKFLDTKVDERRRDIFKMHAGIGYDKKYTYEELSDIFGISRARLAGLYDETLVKLKEFLRINFNDYYHQYFDEEPEKKSFKNITERDEYIYNSYFAINGFKAKTIYNLAEELDMNISAILTAIKRKKQKSSDNLNGATIKLDRQKRNEEIFNAYIGVEGATPLSIKEIATKFNLTQKNIINIISAISRTQGSDKYLKAKQERVEQKKKNLTLTHAKLYFKAKGLYGFEKTTATYLSMEFNYSLRTISKYVKDFENYFNSLSPSEQNEIITALSNPESQK